MGKLNKKVMSIVKCFLPHIMRANMDINETLPLHIHPDIYGEKENKPMQFIFILF